MYCGVNCKKIKKGTVGLTEAEALAKHGASNIKCYTNTFVDMHFAMMDCPPRDKPRTHMKMVCAGPEERVVGLQIVGRAADEMLQVHTHTHTHSLTLCHTHTHTYTHTHTHTHTGVRRGDKDGGDEGRL